MIDTQAIRSKILDLAIRGKLTEQRPEDGTAEELYRQIQAEKQALIKAGKIKKEKPLPEILENDLPFDVPNNWRWVRLQDITSNLTLNDGNWVLSDDMDENGSVKLIQLGSIGDLQYRNKGFKYLTTQRFEELNGKQIYPGYLLINRLVADKMLLCIIPEIEGVLITAVDVCWVAPQNEYYDIKFLMYALASSSIQQKVKEVGYGVTRFRISKTNLVSIPFPFPPLAEQHRIVERIEQAFSVLDTIEALQAQYADNLSALKSKLIEAAIQGELTEQLPEDGTAEDLYRQIQAEKQALIKAGKIKKEKPLPEISADEIPFEIPSNWKWVRLGDYCQKVTDQVASGSFASLRENVKSLKTPDYAVMVKTADFSNGFTKNLTYTDKHGYEFLSNSNLFGGELILSNVGSVGKCFIVPKLPCKMTLAPNAVMVRMMEEAGKDYLYYFLISPQGFKELDAISTGVAVKKFNKTELKKILIPLPPLAEQKRIIGRINELLAVYDKLQ